MAPDRRYSVEQANSAIPWVRERLERLRVAREELNDHEARAALAEAGPTNGGGEAGHLVSSAFLAMRAALGELREMEVVLQDLDRGLVDFPSVREGREVYLCWEEHEHEVGFWHESDAGFDHRRPLGDA